MANTLHVIVPLTNTSRHRIGYRVYRSFLQAVSSIQNIKVYTVEATVGPIQTTFGNPGDAHLQVQLQKDFCVKENLINLAVQKLLPPDWQYMAWVDFDVFFQDPNWAQNTIAALQTSQVVQLWTSGVDIGPRGDIEGSFTSFATDNINGLTGYAWACTNKFYNAVIGLLDVSPLGGNDKYMANAMISNVASVVDKSLDPSFLTSCLQWQTLAAKVTNNSVGVIPGSINHQIHGGSPLISAAQSKQVLLNNSFNTNTDLSYDANGILVLNGKSDLATQVALNNKGQITAATVIPVQAQAQAGNLQIGG